MFCFQTGVAIFCCNQRAARATTRGGGIVGGGTPAVGDEDIEAGRVRRSKGKTGVVAMEVGDDRTTWDELREAPVLHELRREWRG